MFTPGQASLIATRNDPQEISDKSLPPILMPLQHLSSNLATEVFCRLRETRNSVRRSVPERGWLATVHKDDSSQLMPKLSLVKPNVGIGSRGVTLLDR